MGLIGQMRTQCQTSLLSLFTEVDPLEPTRRHIGMVDLRSFRCHMTPLSETDWSDRGSLRKLSIKVMEDF